MRTLAAMLTMIGLARRNPIRQPCNPVIAAPVASAAATPAAYPAALRTTTKTIAETAAAAPSANDIILPPMVINVIAAARQPMKETVVSKVVRLGAERKLGVASAMAASASMMVRRATKRRDGAFSRNPNVRAAEDDASTIMQLSRQS